MARPRIAVWKFASCDGCQLSMLDLEEELLDIVGAIEIAYFPEASREYQDGPYDVSLVEGSVTTPHDEERIQQIREESGIVITITPTYSGCPAMQTMREDIVTALESAGIERFEVRERLSPAWSSDWISPEGREKLVAFGIAAPAPCAACANPSTNVPVPCPHCGSIQTRLTAEFGSTACKALYQCQGCQEPFDYFKPI